MRTPSVGAAVGVTLFVAATWAWGCDRPHQLTSGSTGGIGGAGGGLSGIGGIGGGPGVGGGGGGAGRGGGGGSERLDVALDRATGGGPGGGPSPDSSSGGLAPDSVGNPPPDSGPDLPPDAMTDAVVEVTTCAQINCPQLTQLAADCNTHEVSCTSEEASPTLSNYCYENDVAKQSTRVYSGSDDGEYTTTMRVSKPDGSSCYTLLMNGSSDTDVETWVFRDPAGAEVARGEWNKEEDRLTLICGGVRYVLGDIGCPGTDGEPEPGQCDEGDCSIP
jgi:hypothetical protein